MAKPKKKERKAEAGKAISKREAIVIKAAKDGVAPKLSKSKDTLGIQTSSGRIVLEAGERGLTELGKAYYKAKGISWRPRTTPDLDYLNATPQWTKDGLRQFAVRPNGKKVLFAGLGPRETRIQSYKKGGPIL